MGQTRPKRGATPWAFGPAKIFFYVCSLSRAEPAWPGRSPLDRAENPEPLLGRGPGIGRSPPGALAHPVFYGRRPSSPPNDARRPSEPGGSAAKLAGSRRPRRGVLPPKSHPRMELTELRESAAPGRGDGQGARGAAGGRTAGPGATGEGEPAGLTSRHPTLRHAASRPVGSPLAQPGQDYRLARQQPGPRPGAEAEQGGGGGESSSAARGDNMRTYVRLNRNFFILFFGKVPFINFSFPVFPFFSQGVCFDIF